MVKSVVCDIGYESYLKKLSKLENISIGLIIGQLSELGKTYIVHLAKTNDIFPSEDDLLGNQSTLAQSNLKIDKIEQIDNAALVNHALNAVRMLSGGFNIIGLMVVCPQAIFTSDDSLNKLRSILLDMEESLKTNQYLYGSTDGYNNGDKFVLHYSSINNASTCKLFSTSSMQLQNTDLKYMHLDKTPHWHLIETYYEIDEVYPLTKTSNLLSTVETSMQNTVNMLSYELSQSVVYFEGELVDENELVESIFKKKRNHGDRNTIQTQIYLPCLSSTIPEKRQIIKYDGMISYSGCVNSKIWVHSKNSVKETVNFIKQDIIRSIASRIQFHCQALATISEEKINQYKSHPPRRVFFPIKPFSTELQLCDYLFKWETEETTIQQAKDFLDLNLGAVDIITTGEIIPLGDDSHEHVDENVGTSAADKHENVEYSAKNMSKMMYVIAIIATLLVLIVSIAVHFLFE